MPGDIKLRKGEKNTSSGKVRFNFDVPMLNTLIRYTQCEYIGKGNINSLQKFIEYTDPKMYVNEPSIQERISTIQALLKVMQEGIQDTDMMKSWLKQEYPPALSIMEDVGFDKNQLNVSECEKISYFINEKLQYIEIYQKRDSLIKTLKSIDENADYNVSYQFTIQTIKELMSQLLTCIQGTEVNQGLLHDFSFSDEDAANVLTSIIKKRKEPSTTLQTGIRQLNAILSGGFESGRLYTILGGSGKFKSGTLLNITDQIRRFNPQIIPYENGLRKCVLFITLENSIEETIERLYDMYSDMNADLKSMTTDDIIASLKDEAGFNFSNQSGIDIYMKYAGNLEISTADIYGFVSDLNNRGYQPIAIVVDYIKRIDSAHPTNGDERVRMSFVAKELKNISQYYEIPVITAMQLNREGNSIIDAAMRDSKQDVARFVGTSSIGNAWDIIEDSDWVCLINLELQKSTNQLFLTFKRLKIRGKKMPNTNDYFNHPFTNAKNIRLEPDVDKPNPISIISLANDLESIDEEQNEKKNNNFQARAREKASSASVLNSLRGATTSSMVNSIM